jgi:hypothetical protein
VAAHAQQPLQAGGSGYFGIGVNWVMAQERRNLQRSGASRVVQQQQPTGAEASAASTGTVPAPAAQGTTGAGKQQTPLRQQLQVASGALHAQQRAIEGTTKPLPVPQPVGSQIESILQQSPYYVAALENLIQQQLSMPLPQRFALWATVPAVSGMEMLGLLRQAIPFLKERLRQQAQPDPNLAKLVSALSNDEHLKSALLRESKRLLEQEIAPTSAALYYQGLVKTLKQQEEQLWQELLKIPEDKRVLTNPHFQMLYNQYVQLQRDIMNVGALAAASNSNIRINWQNLLDRAILNVARPVWDLLRRQPLAVPLYNAVENVRLELQEMAKSNPKLQPALEKLERIRNYSGGKLSVYESAEVARLYHEYVEALRNAGLDNRTVDRLSSIVQAPGTLPGLGWSPGPIIEGPR